MEESFAVIQSMLESRQDVTNYPLSDDPSHPPVRLPSSQGHKDPSLAIPHTDYEGSGEERQESEGVE